MKSLFIIVCILLLMSATRCQVYPLEGKTVSILYPQYNFARVRKIQTSCPLKTSDAVEVPLSELTGWCAIPPKECAKYTRDYELNICK